MVYTRQFQTLLFGIQENKEYKQGITFICKKKLLPVGVAEHCNRVPRETVESPSSDVFKIQFNMALSNLLWLTLL